MLRLLLIAVVMVAGFSVAAEARNRPVLRVISAPVRGVVAFRRWRVNVRECRRECRAVNRAVAAQAYAPAVVSYSVSAPVATDAVLVAQDRSSCVDGGLCMCGDQLCRCVAGECVAVSRSGSVVAVVAPPIR